MSGVCLSVRPSVNFSHFRLLLQKQFWLILAQNILGILKSIISKKWKIKLIFKIKRCHYRKHGEWTTNWKILWQYDNTVPDHLALPKSMDEISYWLIYSRQRFLPELRLHWFVCSQTFFSKNRPMEKRSFSGFLNNYFAFQIAEGYWQMIMGL